MVRIQDREERHSLDELERILGLIAQSTVVTFLNGVLD